MRRIVAVVTVGLAVAACGSSSSAPPGGGAQTYSVQLDGKTDSFNAAFTAFFPDHLVVHPGDQIDFQLPRFSGEPHTVAMGTLVNAAGARLDQLGPQATLAAQENSPEMLNLPDVFPHSLPQGPPDANQSAGQPCFLDSGVPPLSLSGSAPACPRRSQPDFNGTQSFYDSGVLMKDAASYSVKLASGIAPGKYQVMCMVHRGGMRASFDVVSADKPTQTQDQLTAMGQQQLQKIVSNLQPVADSMTRATADKALGGGISPTVFNALVAQFGPKDLTIPVGGTVAWNMAFFHSISFNSQESDVGVLTQKADGSIHLNPSGAPANFQVPPAAFSFPPPDNGKPITIDGGRFDGSGPKSTGVIGSVPPVLITVKLTFTKAGTFPYRCFVHPDMKGTIKVS